MFRAFKTHTSPKFDQQVLTKFCSACSMGRAIFWLLGDGQLPGEASGYDAQHDATHTMSQQS